MAVTIAPLVGPFGSPLRLPDGPTSVERGPTSARDLGALIGRVRSSRFSGRLDVGGERWLAHFLYREGVLIHAAYLPPRSPPQFGATAYVSLIERAVTGVARARLLAFEPPMVRAQAARFEEAVTIRPPGMGAPVLRTLIQTLRERQFTGCVDIGAPEVTIVPMANPGPPIDQWAIVAMAGGDVVGVYTAADPWPSGGVDRVARIAVLRGITIRVYTYFDHETPLPDATLLLSHDAPANLRLVPDEA